MTDHTSSRSVLVVTLGSGPRRTSKWLFDLIDRYDVGPEFRFVTIESTELAGEEIPDEFLTIPLDTDSRVRKRFERAKQEDAVPFVNENHSLRTQGSTRVPNVGRFLFEYHSRRVYEMLTEEVDAAVDPGDSELSVWILASLSGGTGAGTFPLASAMVRQIADDIGDRYNIDVYLNGLGTVSELRAANRRVPPSAISDYFVNTNNSLQALSTLLTLPDAHGRPQVNGPTRLEMPVAPDAGTADGLLEPYFDVADPPLDALFLAPIDESRAQDAPWDGDERTSYLARVNYTLASAVLALSTTSSDNDLGNLYSKFLTDRLYTVDAASVRASVEPALDLLRTEKELFAVRSDIENLKSNVAALKSLADDLTTLRSTDVDPGAVPEPATDVSTPLAGRSSQLVEAVSTLNVTEVSFEEVEREISRVLSDVPERSAAEAPLADDLHANDVADFEADRFVPHVRVGQYVFLKMLLARIDAERETHPFEDRVRELWEKNEGDLEESFAGFENADSSTQYEQAIDPFLAGHESDLEDQLMAASIVSVRKKRRLKRKLESLRKTRQELKRLFQEYERLQELRERIARGELPALGSELQETTDLIQTGVDRGSKLLQSKRNRLENLERTRETYRDRVTATTSGRIREIPLEINSTENLSRETLEEASDLFDLVDSGLLTRDSILQEVDRAMGLLEEPLEDNFHDLADNQPSRMLIPMAASGNAPALRMDGTAQPSMGAITANNDVTKQLDAGTIHAPFRLEFVMLHGNVRLANSSEYRVLRERWEEGEVHRVLGEDVDFTQHLAYPELVPELAQPEGFSSDSDDEEDAESDEEVTT